MNGYGVAKFTIPEVMPDDFGIYECAVSNSMGKATINITLMGKNSILIA